MLPVRPEIVPASDFHDDGALAVIAFGAPVAGALLSLDIPQLGPVPMMEVWRAQGPSSRSAFDGVDFAAAGDILIGALGCVDADPERAAACVFDRLIGFARGAGFPHLLRVWNHVRDINRIDDDLERYRAFCAGRYDAFARAGYAMRGDLPAASAVGMHVGGVTTYFVASRTPAVAIENPRQVSAYDYPQRYGPRSPSFSRATAGAGLVFVSGTASVVGHETRHVGDIAAQLEETLKNLETVLAAAGARELSIAKVYVRRAEDYPLIAARVAEAMPGTQTMFVTDMRMPLMNGAELVHRIRRIDPGLAAIVVTAFVQDDALDAARREGLLAALPKPVPIARLVELLQVARRDGLVVVVEDDEALCDNVCEALRGRGFAAVTAGSLTETEGLGPVRPCCALVDMRVPGGPAGEAMRALARRFEGLPMLVVTAFDDPPPLPHRGIFPKPFDTRALLDAVERHHHARATP